MKKGHNLYKLITLKSKKSPTIVNTDYIQETALELELTLVLIFPLCAEYLLGLQDQHHQYTLKTG